MKAMIAALLLPLSALLAPAASAQSLELVDVPEHARSPLGVRWAELEASRATLPVLLPGGRVLLFATQVHAPSPGAVRITGIAPDGERLFVFRSRSATAGYIQGADFQYRLREIDGAHWWVDSRALPRPVAPLLDDTVVNARPGSPGPATKRAKAGGVQVDVLLLYTPGYGADHGGAIGTRLKAAEAIAYTDAAFAASGVPQNYRVVYMQEYAVNELDPYVDSNLSQIGSDAALATLRDQYGADLVTLLRRTPSGGVGVCGLAYLYQGPASSNPSSQGFSVIATEPDPVSGLTCDLRTFAHELGHNMGAAHERAGLGSAGGGNTPYLPYAYAWQCGGFRTIMNYGTLGATDQQGDFFSNPSLQRNGQACGSTTTLNEADNARAHRESGPHVAQHRDTMATPSVFSFSQSAVSVATGDASVTLTLQRSGDLSVPGSVEVYTVSDPDETDAAQPGTDYTEKLERVSFAAGEAARTFTVDLLGSSAGRSFYAVLDFPLQGALGTRSVKLTRGAGAGGSPTPPGGGVIGGGTAAPAETEAGSGGGAMALWLLALPLLVRRRLQASNSLVPTSASTTAIAVRMYFSGA